MPDRADATVTGPGVGEARARLAESARALLEAVAVTDDRDGATLDTVADALDAAARTLAPLAVRPAAHTGPPRPRPGLLRGLLAGRGHPLAPGATWSFAGGVLTARVRFGSAFEGPPGVVHGGVVALAFDELFGMTAVLTGAAARTGRLTVRYRHPTPLDDDLTMTAWVVRREGRRLRVQGSIHADADLTAEAEGLFVTPRRPPTPAGP